VLIHAGRGIPTLGRDALALARRFPSAPLILAHAAICGLNCIWREVVHVPNLFFDASWWHSTDLAALFE
jgi:predicted TIM-barrel fold metal-dependent hydrolase